MKEYIYSVFRVLVALAVLAMMVAWCSKDTRAQDESEPRIVNIGGVDYRLFNEEEMRALLRKLKERELCLKDREGLEGSLKEALRASEAQREAYEKKLLLTRTQLENERDFWKGQFDVERESNLRLTSIFKSCTGRVLGLFRICRL